MQRVVYQSLDDFKRPVMLRLNGNPKVLMTFGE